MFIFLFRINCFVTNGEIFPRCDWLIRGGFDSRANPIPGTCLNGTRLQIFSLI